MSIDSQALFYQTDLINWNTSFPLESINNCPEPPIENVQHNIFFRKFISTDKLMKQFSFKTSNKYPWKIEVSPDGSLIVILKNNNVELRSSKLDFTSINFHCQIYRDLYPQWRCISWSNLSNYFGVTFSNGMCNIWDINGSRLVFKYLNLREFDPVIKLVLTNVSKNRIKVHIITLKGLICFYIIENLKILKYFNSSTDIFSTPILCCEVSSSRNLLVLGTYNQMNTNDAFKNGIISCRFIEEEPFIVSNIDKNNSYLSKTSWLSSFFRKTSVDGINSIRLSNDDRNLAALHLSGILTIWQYPSMKILLKWNPSSDLTNHILTPDFVKQKIMPENYSDFSILQICWWNSQHIVIALQNGRIIVLNLDKSNCGDIYLNPFPQIQESTEKSFFALNCLSKSINTKFVRKENPIAVDSVYTTIWKNLTGLLSVFIQDDSSGFLKNKLEMCSLNFQLICFKLTSPEELFEIQIKKKQYSEALKLAEKYDLDSDIVYQKQWRNSSKTIDDIENILIRIRKKNWILNECVEKIPNQIESMKCLLKLGLKLTALDELQLCTDDHHDPSDMIGYKIDKDFCQNFCERQQFPDNLPIDIANSLNLVQVELVRNRLKLMGYCDKLRLYETIMQSTNSNFNPHLFEEFKNFTPFELAIKFANSGQITELEVLLKFYHQYLSEHLLTILSNIPESLHPNLYGNLFLYLPTTQSIKSDFTLESEAESMKQLDWCETDGFIKISSGIPSPNEAAVELYYDNHQDLRSLRFDTNDTNRSQSIVVVRKWANSRIRNIENRTLNTECAFEFLKVIKSLKIDIDKNLEFNLRFFYEAVYNCQIMNTFLSLQEFESLTNVDKAKLLMSRTDSERFLLHFVRWIIPLLLEIHSQSATDCLEFLASYLRDLARNSLSNATKILQDKDCLSSIESVIDFHEFVGIFLGILFNDDDPTHLSDCAKISRLLGSMISSRNSTSPDRFISEEKQLQNINNYISVLRMMEKYEVRKTIKFVHDNKMNGEIVENLITNMVYQYLKTVRNLNKLTIKSVFSEIQIAISMVFKSIHPKLIYKNLLKSLLESGDKKKINLACEFMDLTAKLSMVNDVNSEDKLLDFHETSNCVVIASQNYINTSTSCKDRNFQLAKYCLNLIQDYQQDIERELDLIRCCEFVEKYNCSLVPIEVRAVSDRFLLLKNCINTHKSLYRNLEEIVEAAGFLHSDKITNRKFNEGEALRLVVEKALLNDDMDILEIVMASLIHRNHKQCWKECIKCLKNPEFPMHRKDELGKYALSHCPKSILCDTLKLYKEIQSIKLLESPESIISSEIPPTIDSNTNSTLTIPIKFLSSGLTDISTKLSLKSLIDKSSTTLTKFSNQVIQFGSQGIVHEFYRNIDSNTNKDLRKMSFNLIYQPNGSFAMKNPEYDSLVKIFTAVSALSSFDKQSEIDKIHLKLLKSNLNYDSQLSLIHSVFISDLELIYNVRHDLIPNLFNRALILSMIKFNLFSKYNSAFQPENGSRIGFQGNISSISDKLTAKELSILQSMEQEFKDYYFLDQITAFQSDISVARFFSSVDYREEIIFQLCEFIDSPKSSMKFALIIGQRYGIDRTVLYGKYLKSFITKTSQLELVAFEKNFHRFQQSFDWEFMMENRENLQNELERFLTSDCDDKNRIDSFRMTLSIFERVDDGFVLFDKSIKEHRRLMGIYDEIFSQSKFCTYLDLFIGCQKNVFEALKVVINVENLELCSQLMSDFQLSERFSEIKNDFSAVLANQTLWSNETDLSGNDFIERFCKSLENFSVTDYENCKDFIYSTIFERLKSYLELPTKIEILKAAKRFVNRNCESNDDRVATGDDWAKVAMEIIIWLDHVENSVEKVVNQLRGMNNISPEIIRFAEYLPPDNYWDCLMSEMLLSQVPYQDFFTFVWELNIESIIVEDVLADHLSHILLSQYLSTEAVLSRLSHIFDEFNEYLDREPIENIITILLTKPKLEIKSDIVIWLLNELVFRTRNNKSVYKFDLRTPIFNVISQWGLPINRNLEISNSNNVFIIDALIQDCDNSDRMALIGKVIELIELVHEDNNLWQCWIKSCIIKGREFTGLIYDQFSSLKSNKLYKDRFSRLVKDATNSLVCFNPSEAISLLILKDPVESVDQIQIILNDLKSDPTEYTNTMKNINKNSLQIIVTSKLIPIYAKTILFQRLVNYITKECDHQNYVQDTLEQLRQNGLHNEATWLASSSTHINPAMKTIEMVSGFWKKFSTGGSS